MRDYSKFSVTEFVTDEFFQSWVLNPDEKSNDFWKIWVEEHPEKKAIIEEARIILQHLNFPKYSLSKENVVQLWERIDYKRTNQSQAKPLKTVPKANGWYRIAASISFIAIVFSGFWFMKKDSEKVYYTSYGETKTIILPDSSSVILNANSQISFTDNWNEKPAREIWLDGEAYFKVLQKADHQPFRVITDNGVAVEVLGTSFNFYHRTANTRVVLNSGQIRLSVPTKRNVEKILMKPGDYVEFKSNKFSKRAVDANLYKAWTENKLVLDHTSLGEIIQMLKDNYGVEVIVEQPHLLKQTVSGSMPMPDVTSPVDQIAKAFRLMAIKENGIYKLKEFQ